MCSNLLLIYHLKLATETCICIFAIVSQIPIASCNRCIFVIHCIADMPLVSCNKCEDCLKTNCGKCSPCLRGAKAKKRYFSLIESFQDFCNCKNGFHRCVQRICKAKVESGRRKGVHTSTAATLISASSLPQVTDKYFLKSDGLGGK